MAERIVYGQKDLEQALCDELKTITLCAGIYDLTLAPGVMFDRLGPVKVSVRATKREAESADMLFWDIYPEYKSEYAADTRVPLWNASSGGGSFSGSGGSYSSSGGSYTGSYSMLGSFYGSYAGSFASSGYAANVLYGYGLDLI